MAAILTLEAVGPKGEALAMEAGAAIGVPVGFDPEFECATFDSSDHEGDELQAAVFETLAGIDPDWQSHLRIAD